MSFHEKTTAAAKGKWRGILLNFGIPADVLRDRHGPCPMCGGKDRFRWDNREGSGSWICNQCGAGDGMKLAMAVSGYDFPEAARRIDLLLGNVKIDTDPIKPNMTDEEQKAGLRRLGAQTRQAVAGDLVDTYLRSRYIGSAHYPKSLRFGPAIEDGEGGIWPAMVAVVYDAEGKPAQLHRTFLRPDGQGKASEMGEKVRKVMPGPMPEGGAVRLGGFMGGALGIAEGIETALAASFRWSMPVWAALNAGQLAKWTPPPECEEVAIFGDNDAHFAGQAAAMRLANRLATKPGGALEVSVHIPPTIGHDWADVWASEQSEKGT